MTERGTLAAKPAGELIEELHHGRKSGRLRFTRTPSKVFKDVWFESGEIISSGTNEPREYLGQYLISAGKITEKDFVRAYRTQVETKVLFGKVLAMFGIVTESEVAAALKGKTEETIWDVFLWPDGGWEFDESASLIGQRLPIRIDVPALVAEGERRTLEWSVIRQTIPDLEFEVELVPVRAGTTPLAPRDERLLQQLARARPPAEAALELRLSAFQLLQRVHELQKRGRLRVIRKAASPPPEPAPAPEPVGEAIEIDVDSFVDRVDPSHRFATGKKGETIGPAEFRARIPVLAKPKGELMKARFDAEEGYLLSRIDGVYDVATVASLCPFRETVALERLADLAVRGIITLQNP